MACNSPVAICEFLYLIMISLFMLIIKNFISLLCIIIQKDYVVDFYPFNSIAERFYMLCQVMFGVVISLARLDSNHFIQIFNNLPLYYLLFQFYFIINFILTSHYKLYTHSKYLAFHAMITQTEPSFINFVKQHPLASALTVGGVSAVLLYYMNQTPNPIKQPVSVTARKSLKTKPAPEHNYLKQQLQIQHQLNHLKTTRQKLIAVTKNFKIQYLQQEILTSLLTQECLLNIFDQCIQLVDSSELNRIYETSRRARRTIFPKILINAQVKEMNRKQSLQSLKSLEHNEPSFPSPMEMTSPRNLKSLKHMLQNNTPITYPEALTFSQMYYRFVCTFEEEFKYLIEKTQKDFVTFLNIDFAIITQSIDFHISKQDNEYFKQEIQEWTSAIRQVLKPKLVNYVSPIEPSKIKQILEYQVRFLTQKRQKLRETIKKLGISNEEQLEALPTLLATILQDEVFDKFGIEQQQITLQMMHLSKNKELEALVQEFQLLTESIAEEMYDEVNKDAIIDDEDDDA